MTPKQTSKIKKHVSRLIKNDNDGLILRKIIFHDSTIIDWSMVEKILKQHEPEGIKL